MITRTFLAAIALASGLAITRAGAEPFAFSYKSHELETAGGRADLKVRLDRAVERYCAASGVRGISARRAAEECRVEVMADILSKIDTVAVARLDQ